MKAKINELGDLLIQRNGINREGGYTPQICHMNNSCKNCSILCPLFGEPKQVNVMNGTQPITQIRLDLCHKTLVLESIDIEK